MVRPHEPLLSDPGPAHRPGWIAHAGLAAGLPAGAPTEATLRRAAALGVDRVELDVAVTADAHLVLVHDERLPSGVLVGTAGVDRVRHDLPEVLTLDEGLEVLASAVPVLVDLKGPAVARPLAQALRGRPSPDALAVCTTEAADLLLLREAAPAVARWRTLPPVAAGPGEGTRRWVACALRRLLVGRLRTLTTEVGAAAVSVDRWAVTPALCREAHRLGLQVAGWTANTPRAVRSLARAGVDLVTTDRVEEVRAAVGG